MQSKKVLRILRISEKYKQRPSEVVGIDNTHLAFCFDEACEFILSMKTIKEVSKNGKTYNEEAWIREPRWIDEDNKPKTSSNGELIAEMRRNLEKFK